MISDEAINVEDLMRHIIHVSNREQLFIKSHTSDKVLFICLGFCYKYGYDILYDSPFEKTHWGALNAQLQRRYQGLGRTVRVDKGLKIPILEDDKRLDSIIVKVIKWNMEDSWNCPNMITRLEAYQEDIDLINKAMNDDSIIKTFPYWTKSEIMNSFDADPSINNENRIPVSKLVDYRALTKYLNLFKAKSTAETFDWREIEALMNFPESRMRTARHYGVYLNKNLD